MSRKFTGWCGAMLTLAGLGVAGSAGAHPLVVWYRSDEACPDAPAFLSRLHHRGIEARVAVAGDPVDFVVTLGQVGPDSSGVLERQTSDGRIAIREVRDARCEAVADALALSLALTHDPEPAGTTATAVPAEVRRLEGTEAQLAADPASEAARAQPAPSGGRVVPARDGGVESVARPEAAAARLYVGAGAHVIDLLDHGTIGALAAFAEVRAPPRALLPGATVRLETHGGQRSESGLRPEIWLVAGRVEACPFTAAVWNAEFLPCVALDVGAIGAGAGGVDDSGFWSAGASHGRLVLRLAPIAFGFQAGVLVPFSRYEVEGPSLEPLEQTRSAAVAAGVNISYGLL